MEIKDGFMATPVLRGFTEIKKLYEIVKFHKCMICGGYVRYMISQRKKVHPADDIDIYCPNMDAYNQLAEDLKQLGFEVQMETEVALSFKKRKEPEWIACPKVQLIKAKNQGAIVATGPIWDILESFDFSVVRCGLYDENTAIADAHFLEDDNSGKVRIKNIHCPISSMARCMKYRVKGFYTSPRESLKLFLDWEQRDDDYRQKISDMLQRDDLSKEEVDQLEALLRID